MLDRLTQDTRLLRLTTPQGAAQLLVECVRGEEAIGKPFVFDISTLSTDASIPLKSLIGQPALLELVTAAGPGALRPFHGHITSIELSASNGGLARYAVRLEPWTAFLAQNRDSRVFQDLSVCDILDAVLGSWQGQGKLVPEWRFELADRAAYPKRSLCTQYQESDWAFAERLMAEEGLFYYFEHRSDGHVLVIADHNGAFQPNAQAVVRFTQPGAVMREDSMDRWRMQASLLTSEVALQSWDYRTLDQRSANAGSADNSGISLSARDVPGAYAYTSREHDQRLAERRLQALDVARKNMTGAGTVRTMAPATRFALQGEPVTGDSGDFIAIRVLHLMHNNLAAQMRSNIQRELGQAALQLLNDGDLAESRHTVGNAIAERPLYRNRIDAIEAALPYRSAAPWKRPTVQGQQTAIVVGPSGAPIHTDRDHRVKVQFHWQRGDSSHSRLSPTLQAGDTGAPADDSAGTWVRVATPLAPIAGANWGSNALPRVGQEVLVDFLEGDIDRPVIIGALYNGEGQADAQHNKIGAGTGAATGNAPVWFPGESGGHAHPASLSGLKSQAMQSSQAGAGAYSQLVFDDSPGQSRVALQRHAKPHQGTAELNLGHLRHQSDNQRLHAVGFGAELKTEHALALRSGQGMLLSTHAARGASGNVLDARSAQNQTETAKQLQVSLTEQAKTHKADLPKQKEADKLAVAAGLQRTADTLSARAADGAPAFDAPLLQVDSPSGIVAATPADALLASETASSMTASQDINFAAQANLLHSSAGGISLFTYGKANAKEKPNQETGLHLHAASGKYSSQSHTAATTLTADKSIAVSSITKEVVVSARNHVLLTTQGAAIRIEGGNIELSAPGKIEFKASKKELGGPAHMTMAPVALPVPKEWPALDAAGPHSLRFATMGSDELLGTGAWAGEPFAIIDEDGNVLAEGTVPENGRLPRVTTDGPQMLKLRLGDPQGAELIEQKMTVSEHVFEHEDGLDEEDDHLSDIDEAADIEDLTTNRYFREIVAATEHHHDEFLPESVLLALINEAS